MATEGFRTNAVLKLFFLYYVEKRNIENHNRNFLFHPHTPLWVTFLSSYSLFRCGNFSHNFFTSCPFSSLNLSKRGTEAIQIGSENRLHS